MNWITEPLGNILTQIKTGSTPPTSRTEYFNGSIAWFTPSDIGKTKKLVASSRTISEEGVMNGGAKLFPKDSLLITCIGDIGRVGILNQPASANQQITALVFNKNIYCDYAYYWFITNRYKLEPMANQAIVPILNNERLQEILFQYPASLDEQKRISALLDRADRLRHTRRYAQQISDSFLQSVFLEMFGDPVKNPSGWKEEQLENILEHELQNGLYVPRESYVSDATQGGTEMVHMSDLFYGIVQRGNLKRINISPDDVRRYTLTSDDILVARRSLTYEGAAKPCRVPISKEPLVCESSMIRIAPDKARLSALYLYFYLSNEECRKAHILKYVTQSTISGINQTGLKSIKVMLPPLKLQEKFAAVVQSMERLRAQQREADRQAEHLFQTLLHHAFSA
jgi:type I restriction enzyme, S subunit